MVGVSDVSASSGEQRLTNTKQVVRITCNVRLMDLRGSNNSKEGRSVESGLVEESQGCCGESPR